MWESVYVSPSDLARAEVLLQRRIEDAMLGTDTTELVLHVLTRLNDVGILRRISNDIGIPDATWFKGGSLADASNDLLAKVPREKIPHLLDAVRLIHPELLEAA